MTVKGDTNATIQTILEILDGCEHANVVAPWGTPVPIRLPGDASERRAVVSAHVEGKPSTVRTAIEGKPPELLSLERTTLIALCPASDGRARWVGVDLDAADGHGSRGLADPTRAMFAFCERADALGLGSGLLASRSQGGIGRHVRLMLSEPLTLDDAATLVAVWAVSAERVAQQDADEGGLPHAFARPDGTIAEPGDSGAIELFPRSTSKPRLGWGLMLPRSVPYGPDCGGVTLEPFRDEPMELATVPQADPETVRRLIAGLRPKLAARLAPRPRAVRLHRSPPANVLDKIHPLTRQLLNGTTPQGGRSNAAYASTLNLLGLGVRPDEVMSLVLAGAVASGLSEREARGAIRSAIRKGAKCPA